MTDAFEQEARELVERGSDADRVRTVRVPVTTAELHALETVPKTLVAATAGVVLMPLWVSSYAQPGGTSDYDIASGSGWRLGYMGRSIALNSLYGVLHDGTDLAGGPRFSQYEPDDADWGGEPKVADVVGQPITFYANAAVTPGLGDFDIVVILTYQAIAIL